MLLNNKTLRKLELEGNNLGSMTARMFAIALRKNKTLRYLDLESNNLTVDGDSTTGIEEMIRALSTNTTLLSLNLGNNKLDEQIGRMFVDCLKINETLIDFEFGGNNFRLEDVSTPLFFIADHFFSYLDPQNSRLVEKKQGQVRRGQTP